MKEGFKGEKVITIIGAIAGIVSAIFIIRASIVQHKYLKHQLKKENGEL